MKRLSKLLAEVKEKQYLLVLLIIVGIGFTPIMGISLRIFDFLSLPKSLSMIIAPSLALAFFLSRQSARIKNILLHGLAAGLFSVFIYDLARWSLSFLLKLNDFIPKIGGWILGNNQEYFFLGYLYRYLGNGGGLGIAFVALMGIYYSTPRLVKMAVGPISLGINFGIIIWACLLITLKVSTHGEELMFHLNWQYLIVTFIGHVVFGLCLGLYMVASPLPGRLVRIPIRALQNRSELE